MSVGNVMSARVKVVLGVAVIVSAGMLTGCNDLYTKDGACVTCFKDPFGVVSVGPSTSSNAGSVNPVGSGVKVESAGNHVIPFTVKTDVDVAYIRMKKEFGFRTTDEIKAKYGDFAAGFKLKSDEFRYDVTPGVQYHMRMDIPHAGKSVVLDCVVEKVAPGKSNITLSYFLPAGADAKSYEASLKARVMKALG